MEEAALAAIFRGKMWAVSYTHLGVPVSTSHIKTTAIVGACARQSVKKVNVSVVVDIFKGWLYTFPVCGVLGFFLTKFLIRL